MQASGLRRWAALFAVLALAASGPARATTSGPWHVWTAPGPMVSNHGLYRAGEFVYDDYIYDDHGANTDGIDRTDLPFGVYPDLAHPTEPKIAPTGGSTRYTGDFMYASPDGTHMANVADLIEFRVAMDASNVYYRFLLGDMTAPDSTVVGMCVDEDRNTATGLQSWPFGAKLSDRLGCDHFYTVFGTGGYVTDAHGVSRTLASVGGDVRARVTDATIEVRVPRSVADPGSSSWRYTVGSGLWGGTTWAAPTPVPQDVGASITTGGSVRAPNIWDLLSNNNEPNSYWDEEKQANDLVNSDLSSDHVDVSFDSISAGGYEPDPQVTGVLERIYVSRHPMDAPSRGIDIDRSLGQNFIYRGAYQPYAMVVPSYYYSRPIPAGGYPFDLCLHPLNGNHNVEVYYDEAFAQPHYTPLTTGTIPQTGYLGFSQITSLVDKLGGVYACVLGRGEGVGYTGGDGLVDVLEVQRDVLAHYAVNLLRRTIHGVSLGAIGSWYVSELYPDRYAASMPYIFTPAITDTSGNPLFVNLYNLPVTYAIGTFDEFAQGTQGDLVANQLEAASDQYLYVHYLGREHDGGIEKDFLPFNLALQYPRSLVVDPARVVYRYDPSKFSPKEPGCGCAYWVSGMTVRHGSPTAYTDITSLARAASLPTRQVVVDGEYVNTVDGSAVRVRGLFRMSAAQFAAMWHPEVWQPGWRKVSLSVSESPLTVPAVSNGFQATFSTLSAVTLDAARMGLSTSSTIVSTLRGDATTTLTLLGSFPTGVTATLDGVSVPVIRTASGITLTVNLGGVQRTLRISV